MRPVARSMKNGGGHDNRGVMVRVLGGAGGLQPAQRLKGELALARAVRRLGAVPQRGEANLPPARPARDVHVPAAHSQRDVDGALEIVCIEIFVFLDSLFGA